MPHTSPRDPDGDGGPDRDLGRDWDTEFAEIAERLGSLSAPEDTRRSSAREVLGDGLPAAPSRSSGESPGERETDDPAVPGFRAQWRLSQTQPGHATRPTPADDAHSSEAPLDDPGVDDDFVAPMPPPYEADDPATVIMIGSLVAGPLWLLYLALFDRETATIWWAMAAGLLVLGFVLGVLRQPKSREDDADDDGARV